MRIAQIRKSTQLMLQTCNKWQIKIRYHGSTITFLCTDLMSLSVLTRTIIAMRVSYCLKTYVTSILQVRKGW